MKDRLESILSYYQLNSSRLAEIIDVQRSGISHILSGRNNPSYDFLIRILDAFPEINANWLLTGKGDMIVNEDEKSVASEKKMETITSATTNKSKLFNSNSNLQKDLQMYPDDSGYISKQPDHSTRSIEKVIILYSDGKFKEYRQE